MRAPQRHIRVQINRRLHPSPALSKLQAFLEVGNNHNLGRRQCSIRLLWRTGRRLDNDPEGRPRRILDRTPPAQTTTTMGFSNPHRIRTRLWCKRRKRTSNLISTPSMVFVVFLLAFSHSLTLFPLFLYLSSLAHAHIYLAMSGRTSFCIYPLVFGYKREDVDIRMRRLGGCCRCRMSNIFAGRPFELGVGTVFALSQGDESSNWRWRVL